MANVKMPTLTMEDAQIVFRNFAGVEGQYNREGDRNFAVVIPDRKVAAQLENDGWNIKYFKPKDEGDEPEAYLSVSVNFKNRPPHVVMIADNTRTKMTEDNIAVLDYADIISVDLVLNPYQWVVGDKTGVKAYLKTMYVKISQDEIERKYADLEAQDG